MEETIKNKKVTDDNQGIEVDSPLDLRPTELPLVVKLPEDASKAQIAFAKVLNGYAYKNPAKFEAKKDDKIVNGVVVKGFLTQLKELKNASDPVELHEDAPRLKINKSIVTK